MCLPWFRLGWHCFEQSENHTVNKMSLFKHKYVKQLHFVFKDHGVTFTDLRKATLIELRDCAVEVGLEIDPDGLNRR